MDCEFGLHVFLLIYLRTEEIDRSGVLIALEDVYELRVVSKFYCWNENDFCVGTTVYNLYEVFHKVHK